MEVIISFSVLASVGLILAIFIGTPLENKNIAYGYVLDTDSCVEN